MFYVIWLRPAAGFLSSEAKAQIPKSPSQFDILFHYPRLR